MAILSQTNPSLADIARRLKADGSIDTAVLEVLDELMPELQDATWMEANDGQSHITTIRSGLPSVTWRKLNYGIQPSKSTTVQVRDTCGMLEALAEIDKKLADLNGNSAAWRLTENAAFLEALKQELAYNLFYGDTSVDPEKFMGLAPRYSDTTAENGGNIILGGGADSGGSASVWLVTWGPLATHMIYPKGLTGPIVARDMGEDWATDANGGKYRVLSTHYETNPGLCVRDWRANARIPNIDVSALTDDAATGSDLITLMIKAIHKLRGPGGRRVFYVPETVYTYLDLQTFNKSNLHVTYGKDVHGQEVMLFRGIPVRKTDALVETEATIS